ncbi:MAG: SMC-Scp complex subunit ScpB [Opitutaceae bacterium]
MAFNLQKVLRALLFSTSQPLSIKDIQAVFARFHDQATLPLQPAEADAGEAPADGVVPADAPAPALVEAETAEVAVEEAVETLAEPPMPTDADLYQDVPSLITAAQIREAMAAIAADLRAADDIYLLIEGPTGFRLVTHPRLARWIRILRDEPPPVKLTQSAIETLAIVAYRQPVTRTEIETIRGVSAEAGINKLLERELVYIVGRADLPGRPLQYGTTDKFLDFVGVKSLVELPSSDVLSPRQIDEWLKSAINPKPITDAEMGLPLEEGEGESPNFEAVTLDHPSASADSTSASPEIAQNPPAEPASEPSSPRTEDVSSGGTAPSPST